MRDHPDARAKLVELGIEVARTERDRALVGRGPARERIHECRLPRARGTDDREQAGRLEVEPHLVEDAPAVVEVDDETVRVERAVTDLPGLCENAPGESKRHLSQGDEIAVGQAAGLDDRGSVHQDLARRLQPEELEARRGSREAGVMGQYPRASADDVAVVGAADDEERSVPAQRHSSRGCGLRMSAILPRRWWGVHGHVAPRGAVPFRDRNELASPERRPSRHGTVTRPSASSAAGGARRRRTPGTPYTCAGYALASGGMAPDSAAIPFAGSGRLTTPEPSEPITEFQNWPNRVSK